MNDFELFKAMNEAEKKYDELRNEFRKRGLHNKPYCEFSRYDPEYKPHEGHNALMKDNSNKGILCGNRTSPRPGGRKE